MKNSAYNIFKESQNIELRVKNFWWKLGGSLFGFITLSLLVKYSSVVNEFSLSLFRLINEFASERSFKALMVLMEAGNAWSITFIVAGLFLLKRWSLAIATGVTTLIAGGITKYILKPFIAHKRPFLALEDVILRVQVDINAATMAYAASGFPSGHTTGFTVVTVLLWPYVTKPAKIMLSLLLAIVSLGRIVAGVHFPIDVVGGWLLGLTFGLLGRQLIPVVKDKFL